MIDHIIPPIPTTKINPVTPAVKYSKALPGSAGPVPSPEGNGVSVEVGDQVGKSPVVKLFDLMQMSGWLPSGEMVCP